MKTSLSATLFRNLFLAVAFLIIFRVGDPGLYARLGETEDAIRSQHTLSSVRQKPFFEGDTRTFILVFSGEDAFSSAVFLDGKCVGESWNFDRGFTEADLIKEMRSYTEVWEPYDTGSEEILGSRSADGNFYATISDTRHGTMFFILAKSLKTYAQSKGGLKL